MNRLSTQIEYLLLSHNCVVVPQFGAFVTRENAARRIDAEGLFLPPNRVVRFNPSVTEDDGLLVGLIQKVNRCRVADAKRLIQKMVLNLRQQLLADGQVDFGTIGVFTQDEDGHVGFEPCQAGAITPEYYGLDAFSMPKLTMLQRNERVAVRHKHIKEAQDADKDRHIVIRINRKSLRHAAMTIAAVFACALFLSPINFISTQTPNLASIFPTEWWSNDAAEPAEHNALVMEAKATVEKTEAATEIETPSAEADTYIIVLASNVSMKNAERYVSDLQERGYQNAAIHDNGKMLRVVLTGYATENDAYNMNSELHHKSKEFANTWVMKR